MSFKKQDAEFLKGFRSYRVNPGVKSGSIENFLHSLDCPRSLAVWIMFRENEHDQLSALEFDPLNYRNVDEIKRAYAATKFLSKYKDLSCTFDKKDRALSKFLLYEDVCRETNSRFRNLASSSLYKGVAVQVLHAAALKISSILGEFSIDEFFSMPDWGPGASTLIRRRDASDSTKFQLETGITRELYSLLPDQVFQGFYPGWFDHLKSIGYPTFQKGNKVITVAKDATIDRVIAIEPGINLWFQKSIGEMINSRLLRVGIDLHDQGRNQRLASIGSITGVLATVDMSSASDSISYELVRELLPLRWFTIMDQCRSHYGTLNDKVFKWEKFSSMGNGFTFSLESLIFYAIAKSCDELFRDQGPDFLVSVYGDDIIIPTRSFRLLSEMMSFFGFRINEKKSHFNSPFRESCGAHFFLGSDVKPIFLKEELSSIQSVYRLANAIRRLSHRWAGRLACDVRLRPAFDYLIQKSPKAFRFLIPDGLGDGGFIMNFDEATPVRVSKSSRFPGWEGWFVRHSVDTDIFREEDRLGYLLAELWRISDRKHNDIVPKSSVPSILQAIDLRWWETTTALDTAMKGRNAVSTRLPKARISKSIVRQWCDLGQWL